MSGRATLKFAHYGYESGRLGCDEEMHMARHDHIPEQEKVTGSVLARQLFHDNIALVSGQRWPITT